MSTLTRNVLILCFVTHSLPALTEECDGYIGAGILPYVVLENGSINVLLAHEQGRGWSSFGGGPKILAPGKGLQPRCETRRETAIRETLEESRLVLSRQALESAIQTAEIYPRQYTSRDFLTFVIAVPQPDIEGFTSNTLPTNDPGYHETNALGWVALEELLRLVKSDKNEPVVPAVNDAGFYRHFRRGLIEALRTGDVKLFKS